jgi:hypothetical protein
MTRRTIATPEAPAAIGTYSQAVAAGGAVWLSGQIPLDPRTMKLVEGTSRLRCARCSATLRRSQPPPARRSTTWCASPCSSPTSATSRWSIA